MQRFDGALKPGWGVLDIGANTGSYSKRYAEAVGETGHVLGVEPDHDCVIEARHKCEGYPWVTIMEVAVTDAFGTRPFHIDRGSRTRNSLWKRNLLDEGGGARVVHTVTLDHLAGLVPNLRAIKVDAQGAEGAILAGGEATLARQNLIWQLEIWPRGLVAAGSSPEAVIDAFESRGWVTDWGWDKVREELPRHQSPHSGFDIVITRGT